MTGALVLLGALVLYLARRRNGAARWVLAAPVAAALAWVMFDAATTFYAAGGMAGLVK